MQKNATQSIKRQTQPNTTPTISGVMSGSSPGFVVVSGTVAVDEFTLVGVAASVSVSVSVSVDRAVDVAAAVDDSVVEGVHGCICKVQLQDPAVEQSRQVLNSEHRPSGTSEIVGTGPVSGLVLNRTSAKVIRLISVGIVPVRRFVSNVLQDRFKSATASERRRAQKRTRARAPASHKTLRDKSWPISLGMVPVSRFKCKYSSTSPVRMPISLGMLPVSLPGSVGPRL
jgi:hypothetical protein